LLLVYRKRGITRFGAHDCFARSNCGHFEMRNTRLGKSLDALSTDMRFDCDGCLQGQLKSQMEENSQRTLPLQSRREQ
jgi:hypothetical protein